MSFVLLGILNSQAAGAVGAGAYDLLETQTLTSSASSVDFTGLGSYSNYKHLQLRGVAKSTQSGNDIMLARLNNRTVNDYSAMRLNGDGNNVEPALFENQTNMRVANMPGSSVGSDIYNAFIIDILDFNNTSKLTTINSFAGYASSTNRIEVRTGVYSQTTAVTEINLLLFGPSYAAGSRFSLYGIKG